MALWSLDLPDSSPLLPWSVSSLETPIIRYLWCDGQCMLPFDGPLPTLSHLLVLDDHSVESCCWRSFWALGRLLSHITPGQHFYYINFNFILSHKIITQLLEVTHISYLSFHGSGLWAQLSWALCSRSHKAVVKIRMGRIPFLNSRFSSKLMRLLAEFHFLVVVGFGSMFSGWPSTRGCS